MTLPETIRASLAVAAAETDASRLRDTYSAIKDSLAVAPMPDRVGIRTLILCAETALKVGELDIAEECLQTYEVESLRYGPDLAKFEVNDQFVIRCGYAKALLRSLRTRHLKGQDLVDGTLACIKDLMEVINIAGANDRYTFLIYNGSVQFYHISRPLQHDGVRHHLTPSLEALTKLLEKVPRQVDWKARNALALALCYSEGGKPDDAIKCCQQAIDLGKEAGLQGICDEALALKVHIGQMSGKGGKESPPDPADAARAAVQLVLSGGVQGQEAVEAALKEAWARVDPAAAAAAPDKAAGEPTKGVDLDVISEVGWAAALSGCSALAATCAARAGLAKALGPRMRSELTIIQLMLAQNAAKGDPLSAATVTTHVAALKRLEMTLISLLRADDFRAIQECCVLMWNAGLPLLQPALRHHVGRAFAAGAAALETIASPLHRLRAQLLLELAGCNVDSDMLAPAAANVAKGLALDYSSDKDEVAKAGFERPLDRYLNPMEEVLRLKTDIYSAPGGPFAEAILAVEQARDSKRATVKQDALERACELLASLPPVRGTADPAADGGEGEVAGEGEDPEARRWAAKRRVSLWGEVVKVAWAAPRAPASARRAARHALESSWDPAMDPEMLRLQAECCYIDAEAAAAELLHMREPLVPPPEDGAPPAGSDKDAPAPDAALPAGGREAAGRVDKLLRAVARGFVRGMQLGNQIKEAWLVTNGAVLVWNHYIHIMRKQEWSTLAPLLLQVTDQLLALEGHEDEDVGMLCQVANAAACACEHEFLLARNTSGDGPEAAAAAAAAGAAGGYLALVAAARAVGAADKDSAPLGRAAALADKIIARSPPGRAKRSLVSTLARIKAFQGLPASGDDKAGDKTSVAIALIESLSKPELSAEQRKAAINGAMAALREESSVDVELWAKLGLAAFNIGSNAHAIECGKMAASVVPAAAAPVLHPEDQPSISPRMWYWLALAESVFGRGAVASIRPDLHDYAAQDSMRRLAMGHFLTSARYGSFIGRRDMVDAAARHFWNAATPFMRSPATRTVLTEGLKELVELVRLVGVVPESIDFLVSLYEVLLEALSDAEAWAEGLGAADAAFKVLPSSHHKTLWEWKVLFLSRSGRGVQTETLKIKSYEPKTQARIWANIAPSFPLKYDQLAALHNAVDCLKDVPWESVEALVDYAEWINTNTGNSEAAADVLTTAADALLRVEDREGGGGEASSSGSPSRSAATNSPRAGTTAGSVRSAKTAGSKSAATKKTAAKYPDVLDLGMMRQLVRVFLSLFKISNSREERADYLHVAQHYAQRVLVTGIDSVNSRNRAAHDASVAAAAAAAATAAAAASVKGNKGKDKDGKEGKKKEEEEIPPPVLFTVPQAVHEWLEWEPSAALVAALAADGTPTGMSGGGLERPELFIAELDLLSHTLQEYGMHVHCVPVLHLSQLVAAVAVQHDALQRTFCLKLSRMLEQLNLPEAAARAERRAGPLAITPEEMTVHKQLVEQRLALNAAAGLGGASDPADGRASVATIGGTRHKSGARMMEPTSLREVFLARGRFLVSRGQYEGARVLLEEALLAGEAFQDLETQGWCKLYLAKLEVMAGNLGKATKLLNEAKALGGEPRYWKEVLHAYVQVKLVHSDTRLDAKDAVAAAADLFRTVAAQRTGAAAAECRGVEAWLLQQRADIVVDEMFALLKEQRNAGSPVVVKYMEAVELMAEATEILADVGCGPDQVNAFQRHAVLIMTDVRPVPDVRGRLGEVRDLLAMAAQVGEAVCYRGKPEGLSARVSLPTARQLAAVKQQIAHVDLDLASAALRYEAEDKAGARPDFPTVPARPAAPVEAYLDGTAPRDLSLGLAPVERAVMSASDAAALQVVGGQRAAPLYLRGKALLAHYTERSRDYPWRPRPKPASPTPQGEEEAGDDKGDVKAEAEPPVEDAGAPGEGAGGAEGGGAAAEAGAEAGAGAEGVEAGHPEVFIDGFSSQLVRQARESLEEALRLAVAEEDEQTAARAALELADLCMAGQPRPEEAAEFILQSQSCMQRGALQKMYRVAAEGGGVERLLMQQSDHLGGALLNPSSTLHGADARAQAKIVSDLPAVLDMTESISEIRKSLPPGVRVVSVFLADSKHHLYVTGVWNPTDAERAAAEAAAKETETEPVYPTGVVVDRVEIDAEAFAGLVAETTQFKRAAQKFVSSGQKVPLKRRMSMMMTMRRLSMRHSRASGGSEMASPQPQGSQVSLAKQSSISKGSDAGSDAGGGRRRSSFAGGGGGNRAAQVNEGWTAVLANTNSFLAPAMPALREAVGREAGTQVVLLLNFELSVLPWEALELFGGCAGLSRDFSIHTLNYRLTSLPADAAVAAADVSFLVDPKHEDCAAEHNKQKAAGRKTGLLADEFRSQLAGVLGKDGLIGAESAFPSQGECQQLMAASKGLLFLGMNRFLAYVRPRVLSGLRLEGMHLAVLADRMTNEAQERSQAWIDNRKTPEELEVERPHHTAALLTLRGVKSIVMPSMVTKPDDTVAVLGALFKGLGAAGTVGAAVKAAGEAVESDLPWAKCNMMVYGLPSVKTK